MPAIQLSKLNKDLADIFAYYYETDVIVDKISTLYEYYANYSLKPNTESTLLKDILAYSTPPLLTNQILISLKPQIFKYPDQAQVIIESLWHKKILDIKLLSMKLLCTLSEKYPNGAISTIGKWCHPMLERYFVHLVFSNAAVHLIRSNSDVWTQQMVTWLSGVSVEEQTIGILAANASAQEPEFINLPPIFDNITNHCLIGHPQYFFDLQSLLTLLARRSPNETMYFIRHLVGLGMTEMTHKLLRKVIQTYPKEDQNKITNLLKSALP